MDGAAGPEGRLEASYVLPLRWAEPGPIEELASYLRRVAGLVREVIVVDGSPEEVFERHGPRLRGIARHLPPHPELDFAMGKVNGVVTGVRECACERVVIADDDVRYEPEALRRVVELLGDTELVRPQNFFDELPWHARWDTARSLLNRVFTGDLAFPVGDFPGTLAVRRSAFVGSGAYDGDALFENLELMRTIRAAGGRVVTPLDLYVARRPPTTRHFLSQRVRQAYDDFAIPLRLGGYLAVLPGVAALAVRQRWRWLLGGVLGSVAVAEAGRRRAGGARRFPLSGSLMAPAWVAERSVCAWLAVWARLRGGVKYGQGRLVHSATPLRTLRRRYREASGAGVPGGSGEAAGSPGNGPDSARNPIAL